MLYTHAYTHVHVCVHIYITYKFYTYYILQCKDDKVKERGKHLSFTQRGKEFDSKTLART